MNSESLAAAGLLEALSRASEILADLRHPFVRSERFSYFFPPAGARVGTTVVLPDGREITFEVSIAASGRAFHVEGGIQSEEETLLELPRKSVPDIEEGLAAFDDYAGEVAAPAERLIGQMLEELSDN
ncbi:unnamed protein product [[Actinomadura] parvosata subsp. kistnae]|uniref:Uncharacterized protein n=1 Tax=[Actinomadura] parvosata subsp. kistnae TaxID=1909395 RepID=A0A1V0AAV5_9ACTN|nr:hypothetical protein [Nonomuraea sp. ATCC 55076]AQZ67303.1 hypothetical protein BKM31_42840 [Nonomuraea sp. ATCC 55076]SPL94469.1 unnamed protein product [Actinomadura parvosata subsp. kistnae]